MILADLQFSIQSAIGMVAAVGDDAVEELGEVLLPGDGCWNLPPLDGSTSI